MDFQDMFPDKRGSEIAGTANMEQEAVRRLLVRCGLPTGTANTFAELRQNTAFGYHVVPHKFDKRDLDALLVDMKKRPTKTKLLVAYEDAYLAADSNPVALIFVWPGFGGLHALTGYATNPIWLGSSGIFWLVDGSYYLLEPFDSFCDRVGPAEDW